MSTAIFIYINKRNVKQQRYMPELHSFASDVSDSFADLYNSFQILENSSWMFYAIHHVVVTETTHF